MAIVICKLHGDQPAPLACPHLAKLVDDRERFSEVICVKSGVPPVIWIHYFCQICAKRWNLSGGIHESPESVGLNYRDALETTLPICGKCFSELRLE
jgi:hypothetical protein